MERTDTGLLIAFEGIDGAGKTTQVGLLEDFFRAAGVPAVRSKEPTDGPWGRRIRGSAATGRMAPADELTAFTEDRKEHVRTLIAPALARGEVVVLDRYFYSTIAYQGEATAAQQFAIAPTPDVVLLIDVPAEVGVARISSGRGERPNAFEQLDELRATRERFLALAKPYDNIRVVDGVQPAEAVRREVLHFLLDGPLKRRFCAKGYGCDDPFACGHRAAGLCRWAAMCRVAKLGI